MTKTQKIECRTHFSSGVKICVEHFFKIYFMLSSYVTMCPKIIDKLTLVKRLAVMCNSNIT